MGRSRSEGISDPSPEHIATFEREARDQAAAERKAAAQTWSTTEQMIADLSKVGVDASKFKLPSRAWTPDEAYEALKQLGITGDSFTLPGEKPRRREDILYPNQGGKR